MDQPKVVQEVLANLKRSFSEDVSANFSISACNDGTCIPIEERFYFYKNKKQKKYSLPAT